MSANVGLSTPRGSGTSGYVQRNLSHLKPRDNDRRLLSGATGANALAHSQQDKHVQRQPDPAILEHERKRRIEVQLFELRDQLEDEGVDDDEIDDCVDKLRAKLEKDEAKAGSKVDARAIKGHQVHDLAKAKIEETEKVRRAFGISKDYEEGSHWKRQEERKLQAASDESRPRASRQEEDEHGDGREDTSESERERRFDRQRKRRSYRDRDGERWEDQRSRSRSPE